MTTPTSSDQLDYPKDWAKKKDYQDIAVVGTLVTLFSLTAAFCLGASFFSSDSGTGNLLTAVLTAVFAVASAVAAITFTLVYRNYKRYIASFFGEVEALAKSRHGIELNGQARNLFISPSVKVEVNLGDQRISIVRQSLTTGEDIRFYYADTNEEIAIVSKSSVVAAASQQTMDLPKAAFEYRGLVSRSQYWMDFAVLAMPAILLSLTLLVVAIAGFAKVNGTEMSEFSGFTLFLVGGILIAIVLTGLGLWLKSRSSAINAKVSKSLVEFNDVIDNRYGLALSDADVKYLYTGSPLTTNLDSSRVTIRMSHLVGGKDVRLVEDKSEKELPVLQA